MKKKNNENGLIAAIACIMLLVVGSVIYSSVSEEKAASDAFDFLCTAPLIMETPKALAAEEITNDVVSPSPIASATPVPQIPDKVMEYRVLNEDTIGYINIKGTVIDYPVMYSGDNEFYLNNDFNKQSSYYGAIFLDYRCDVYDMAKTKNIILYGHRMKDGSMFRSLVYYFEKDFFDSHRIVRFDTLAGTMDWEVFAIFEANINFYYIDTEFSNEIEWLKFIRYCQSLSLYETDTVLTPEDIVLTLSTCSTDKDHRVVVMARLIQH
ncbi:MAG: class B sortase [Clostridia bacterium]|nr:class B sortase [Clostridia bacterium]